MSTGGGFGRFERTSSPRLGGGGRRRFGDGAPDEPELLPVPVSWTAEEAFRTLAAPVQAYLRGQGAPDPEDLLGEVFLQVARSIGGFTGTERDLRRWVFAIARNRLVDEQRRGARRPSIAEDHPVPDRPVEQAADGDADLHAALASLTPEQREVLGLRFVADLSLDDVAELTGRPPGAVKSMQHRALAALARLLDGDTGGAS